MHLCMSENLVYSQCTRVTHSWPIHTFMTFGWILLAHSVSVYSRSHTFFRFHLHRGATSSGHGACLVQALWAIMLSLMHSGNLKNGWNSELGMIYGMLFDKWTWIIILNCTPNTTRSCSCGGTIFCSFLTLVTNNVNVHGNFLCTMCSRFLFTACICFRSHPLW